MHMNNREDKRRNRILKQRRLHHILRRKKKYPRQEKGKTNLKIGGVPQDIQKPSKTVRAPKDFRLLNNTIECINFFKKIRNKDNAYMKYGHWEIKIDLSGIEKIDFASTMMLDAICEELSSLTPPCNIFGTAPLDDACRQYLLDSGFLNNKYNEYGRKFPDLGHSANIKIERGRAKLEDGDIQKVVDIEKRICRHVTGVEGREYSHINMIKEICGNTVDWSGAIHDQWVYGTKFEDGRVIGIALDLGKGILETIVIKFENLIKDLVKQNSHIEILDGAFNRKYGSKSGKPNRNRGLPSIKRANENGRIKDLVVITNNVILDFTNKQNNCKFASRKSKGFNGTLYSWVIDASCYQK